MLSLRIIRRFSVASNIVGTLSGIFDNGRNMVSKKSKDVLNGDENALLEMKKEKGPEKLFDLFEVVVEDVVAFEDMVCRLAGEGRFDCIESLLEQQKGLDQGRCEGFVVRIIGLYGKVGMSRHAVKTFFDMHLYGCERTVESFNATLGVLAESGDVYMIESFYRDVPRKFDITIDTRSLDIVVNTFCKMGVLDKACMFVVEAEKFGLCPEVVTYNTLMSAFYKARHWEFANGVWNLMVRKGCSPNLATFNARILFLADNGRASEANEILAKMHLAKVTPDEITYNLVIKACVLARRTDILSRVCSDFYRQGDKPNEYIYQTIIHYLCIAGDYDLAFTKCQESMASNFFPSLPSLYMLLEGLWKKRKRDKAIFILTLARQRVPPYTKQQLQAMQSILSHK